METKPTEDNVRLTTTNVVNLVPVGLKEAALDSPSFRAAILHNNELVDQTEKWLDGCLKAIAKVSAEIATIDGLLSGFLTSATLPDSLSEAAVDYDHPILTLKKHDEISKQWWSAAATPLKKLEANVSDPLRQFVQSDIKAIKEIRRQLDQSQRAYDGLQSRYSAQGKSKEPSSLREDAFQLHESRKSYLKASLDFACAVPQFKHALDKLLVHTFGDQVNTIWAAQESSRALILSALPSIGRAGNWAQNISSGEKGYRRHLLLARRQIEESAEYTTRPSRDLDDYSTSALPGALAGARVSAAAPGNPVNPAKAERQGWLNLKMATGKPARTIWGRKWFYLRSGIFGWLVQGSRSGGVEESDRIGVLLCSVRVAAAEERRFCFDVKTKDGAIVLQADSAQDLSDWMATFESAKQSALANTSNARHGARLEESQELAFAISPPNAPEFAASAVDAGLGSDEGHDRGQGHLAPSADQGGIVHRGSFDVSAPRRSTALESDSGKDQASKIIQKLDLHRKPGSGSTTAGPNASSSALPPTGGIATLISASSMALPLGTAAISQTSSFDANGRLLSSQPQNRAKVLRSLPATTLAPRALANPPIATNLSWTATVVSGEKGASLGWVGGGRTAPPPVINANIWGSSRSQIHWLEQSDANQPRFPNQTSSELLQNFSSNRELQENIPFHDVRSVEKAAVIREHRKTISLDGKASDLRRAVVSQVESSSYYPAALKHQDAQFRLLFPHLPLEEKLVMVFRASWPLDEHHDFPGTIFVTTEAMMFYSHHFGMVLTTGLSLSRIQAVSAKPGTQYDLLCLQLQGLDGGPRRSSIKVFLEPLQLLRRRLALLVQNACSPHQLGIEELFKQILELDSTDDEDSTSPGGESPPLQPARSHVVEMRGVEQNGGLQARVLVNQGLDAPVGQQPTTESTRFKLPNKPVVYQPDSNAWGSPVVESDFRISPKALFHVIFGDRGAIWHTLYRQRRARNIKQGPWTRENDKRLYRAFEYCIEREDLFGAHQIFQVTDTQVIDVLSDHLCYVVNYRKTPWHLPHFQHIDLLTKVVISFVAKSRCKLAIYARVEWSHRPWFTAALIEEQALQDIKSDVSDIADLVAEQARRLRLGSESGTKNAIEIFGSIGQQTQIMEYADDDHPMLLRDLRFDMKQKSIAHLLWDGLISLIKYALNLTLVALAFVAEWGWNIASANSFLLLMLAASFLLNMMLTTQPLRFWWEDRRAAALLGKLGVGGELSLGRRVGLKDLEAVAQPLNSGSLRSLNHSCFQEYQSTALQRDSSPTASAQSPKLHRFRKRVQSHRHDLLVAMRVVNRVEYEVHQSEFEEWLQSELQNCQGAMGLLSTGSTDASASRNSEDIQTRLHRYCQSCRDEAQQPPTVSTVTVLSSPTGVLK